MTPRSYGPFEYTGENSDNCVQTVSDPVHFMGRQCSYKRKDGNYCTRHAKRLRNTRVRINGTDDKPRWAIVDAMSIGRPMECLQLLSPKSRISAWMLFDDGCGQCGGSETVGIPCLCAADAP